MTKIIIILRRKMGKKSGRKNNTRKRKANHRGGSEIHLGSKKLKVEDGRKAFFSQAKNQFKRISDLDQIRIGEDERFEEYRKRAKSFLPLGSPGNPEKKSKIDILRKLHAKIRFLQMGQRSHSMQQKDLEVSIIKTKNHIIN